MKIHTFNDRQGMPVHEQSYSGARAAHDQLADSAELEYADYLNHRYRTYHGELSPADARCKPYLPSYEWQVQLTADERAALEQHLGSLDMDERLARIEIDGLYNLPFAYTAADLHQLLRVVPAIAFEGIRKINFQPASGSGESVLGPAWHSVGFFDHSLEANTAEIVILTDPLHDQYQAANEDLANSIFALDGDADGQEREAILSSTEHMVGTLLHEFGHALHHTLPVSLLHEWDVQASRPSRDEPVTTYVASLTEMADDHAAMEDFADSFRLYMLRPQELQWRAPTRYVAMQHLINSCR